MKGESVKIASERSLTPASAATQISHIVVEIDRGIEFDTALKALADLELDSLADRSKLEAQMKKAKSRFDDLKTKFGKAA